MTLERRRELLGSLAGVRTLVVGDAMVDEYIWGQAERISPEAPVPVVHAERVTQVPGGAANVVHCVRELGAAAGLCAVIGDDEGGARLHERLAEFGVDPILLTRDPERPTTVKTRVVAQTQQVVRIDRETRDPLSGAVAARLLADVEEALPHCRGMLLSDYEKGVLTPDTIARLLELASERDVRVAVNAKPGNASAYAGVDLLTVNRAEAAAICGFASNDVATARRAAEQLRDEIGCRHALVTLGPDGAVLAPPDGPTLHVPPVRVQVFDVAGAGDTTIAAAHLALCAGAPPDEAVALAMRAAAVVVRKVGVATARPDEILALESS